MTRLRLIVVALLLVTGCEVFFAIKESSPGGTGGTSGTGTSSAGTTTGSSSTGSGAVSTGSGTVSASSGTTSSSSGTGGAQAFCVANPGHTLCADFDEHSIMAGWSSQDQSAGGDAGVHVTSALDTGNYASPPASLAVTSTTADLGTSCQSSRLILDFPDTATGLGIDFDFSGCGGVLTGNSAVLFLNVDCTPDDGGTFGLVKWGLHAGGYQLDLTPLAANGAGPGAPATLLAGTPAAGGFSHVHLDLVFGDPGSAVLTVEGLPTVDAGSVDLACASNHSKAVGIGMLACDQLVDCTVHFDNVLIDIH